jgi:hypothetical protein
MRHSTRKLRSLTLSSAEPSSVDLAISLDCNTLPPTYIQFEGKQPANKYLPKVEECVPVILRRTS